MAGFGGSTPEFSVLKTYKQNMDGKTLISEPQWALEVALETYQTERSFIFLVF